MKGSPRGFALLIVLWSVVLLALLATGLTAAGRSDLQLAGNIRRAAAAEAAADGGVEAAVFHAADIPAAAWAADGQPHTLRIGAYTVAVRVMDENGKVNPNFVQQAFMAAMLTALGAEPSRASALAQSIADWYAPGAREPVIARYRSAGMSAAPTGTPFRSVAELGLVLGMTPDLLARLAPYLSVYATGPLQIARADPLIQDVMRGISGGAPLPPPVPPTVLNITADAAAPDGGRFIRHAVVKIGDDRDKRPFRTLLWESMAAD